MVRRQIGFMSANTAVYDRMTAWEMVEYFGRLHGIPVSQLSERMERLFDRLKMNDIRDLLGAKMSTGMKQKVSIARALVHAPSTLLLDEPTNSLDLAALHALRGMLREIARAGTAVVTVTQQLHDIIPECDRIVLMRGGRIIADGPRAEVLTDERIGSLFGVPVRLVTENGWFYPTGY